MFATILNIVLSYIIMYLFVLCVSGISKCSQGIRWVRRSFSRMTIVVSNEFYLLPLRLNNIVSGLRLSCSFAFHIKYACGKFTESGAELSMPTQQESLFHRLHPLFSYGNLARVLSATEPSLNCPTDLTFVCNYRYMKKLKIRFLKIIQTYSWKKSSGWNTFFSFWSVRIFRNAPSELISAMRAGIITLLVQCLLFRHCPATR